MEQNQLENLEKRIIKHEEHCPFNVPEKLAISNENVRSNIESIKSEIIKNQDDIRKILLLNKSLIDQAKTQSEIVKRIQESLQELKTIKIMDSSGAELNVSINDFSKYVLERISPEKQARKWVNRIKDYGFLIAIILVIFILLFSKSGVLALLSILGLQF